MPFCFGAESEQVVESWTTWYLNFSGHKTNTAEDDHYRKELSDRLSRLRHDNSNLRAIYTCREPFRRDLENVLLYNVNTSVFGFCRSLCFERKCAEPPAPPMPFPGVLAYVRYEVLDSRGKIANSSPSPPVLEAGPVSCAEADLKKDAGRVWKLLKSNMRCAAGAELAPNELFKVDLTIWSPKAMNLATISKKLLDGFLSALHHRAHDDTDLDEVISHMEARYRWDREQARVLLLDNKCAVLGHHAVPKSGKRSDPRSLVWSPHDHRLVACELIHEELPDWRLKASLSRIPISVPPCS